MADGNLPANPKYDVLADALREVRSGRAQLLVGRALCFTLESVADGITCEKSAVNALPHSRPRPRGRGHQCAHSCHMV
jgi:hypothetical protein